MRQCLIGAFATCAAVVFAAGTATAQDTVNVGFVLPMTGQLTSVGKQVSAGAQLYIQQHGNSVAGKKIELLIRDDGGVPDVAKRVAQELLVNDKVAILGGGLTPSALAMAPLATEAMVPEVVVISGTSIVTERSPYIVRVSFTLGQSSGILGDWAAKNGSKKTGEGHRSEATSARPNAGVLQGAAVGRVDAVNLEHVLGDIQTDRCNLHWDRSLM